MRTPAPRRQRARDSHAFVAVAVLALDPVVNVFDASRSGLDQGDGINDIGEQHVIRDARPPTTFRPRSHEGYPCAVRRPKGQYYGIRQCSTARKHVEEVSPQHPSSAKRMAMRIKELNRKTAPAVVEAVFEGLSAESRYLRFHRNMTRLDSYARGQLVDVDGVRHVAVGAFQGNQAVGVGRLIAITFDRAEFSVAVVDRWQRHGIGRKILRKLTRIAARIGYTEMYGAVLPENIPMIALVRSELTGVRITPEADGLRVIYTLGNGTRPDYEITQEDLVDCLQKW
ncbi:Acetyltransferase (GNAT) family protein [Lentzea xinjiangensis]|uniref:Acetyltransferase (GNAT) family protein n=2 Tax=Lentzea xinjiangensis TaxID=402600 RepID=A0A1H9NC87_9PSEU|nr:Acetyltransferase (GNAT) family protein [Lentzea xinjiangensis]